MTDKLSGNRHKKCHQFMRSGNCSYGSKCKFTHETTVANLDSMFRNLTLDEGRRRLTQLFESIGDPRAHIRAFFDKYDDFDYQPTEPVMEEFYRMCDYYRWSSAKDANKQFIDPDREMASRSFKDALTVQFNAIYGTDENSLVGWQNLCVVLNLKDVPEELDDCRDLVHSMFVNIIDLVEVPVTLRFVEHFKTEMALSKYTKRHGKYFPLDNAYAGGLLKFLLRRIMVPRKSPDDPVHDSDSDCQSDLVILPVLPRIGWTRDYLGGRVLQNGADENWAWEARREFAGDRWEDKV